MAYIPLYRKWRSQNFNEIVGQEAIVQTLKNAIKGGRVSHAYLFSGPRGTGKTSTARIFAKALNCVKGPTPDPCGKCDMCERIRSGHAVDVIEIDAASNRGIDEIRDLREKVRYTPVEGKYKVYIIDEVHMLTSEAFNAILKTLEEPPAHVIFVLATTEPQKMPVTITSRCQRLDFRRLSNAELISQLKKIADAEGVKIEDSASTLIARNSEGSMRDAISLLDQLVSFCGKSVKHDDVVAVLGTANTDQIFELGQALGKSNVPKLFDQINKMVSEGRSVPQVTKDLLLHLRNLLLVMLGSDSVIEESSEHILKLKEEARSFSIQRLKHIIGLISRAETDMKWHPQARLLLEVAVMEACEEPILPERTDSREEPAKVKLEKAVIELTRPPESRQNNAGISDLRTRWDSILEEVKKHNVFAFISLHEGEPVDIEGGKLSIKFRKGYAFHKGRLEEDASRRIVEDSIKKVLGKDIRIDCIIEKEPASAVPAPSASKVAEIFNGKIVS